MTIAIMCICIAIISLLKITELSIQVYTKRMQVNTENVWEN